MTLLDGLSLVSCALFKRVTAQWSIGLSPKLAQPTMLQRKTQPEP